MGTYADAIASVSISQTSRTPTQQGFGTPLVAAYHTLYLDRVRAYGGLPGMVADGFTPYDFAYRAAASAFAQNPAPPTVKIGRRALAMTQVVHLTPTTPAAGEVYTVEIDGLEATYTADSSPTVAEVVTGVTAAINALADVDAIIATGATTTGEQVFSGAQLDGATGGASLGTPRLITLTLSSHADWDSTTATLEGLDGNGETISEDLTIPNGGNTTLTTTKRFLRATSLTIPAQSGTGGTFTMGVAKPVTAVATGGTHVVCTAAAGWLHSYEVTSAANLALADETADPGIATDLTAIQTADPDFYGVLLDSNSQAEIEAAAVWVEAHEPLEFVWQSADAAALDSGSTTDVFYTTKAAGYVRSAGAYHPKIGTTDAWLAAGWMGEEFPKEPGSSTWMFKTIAGVSVYELTTAQRTALEAKNGNHYLSVGGLSITGPGESSGGDWLDVIRDLDWLRARIREDSVAVFTSNDKVVFTNEGISLLVAALRRRLTDATNRTILADDPKFTVSAPRASAVSTANKRARHLPSVTFTGTLAGAIHSVSITGRVSA